MIRIGVLGAGHLGKIHLRLLKEIPDFQLVGFYDPDPAMASAAEEAFGVPALDSIDEIIENCDAVDIVTPTLSHFESAEKALRNSLHCFIEKPITNTTEEAKKLMNLAHEAKVSVQVGHVERFNPAFLAAQPHLGTPMFIETHRLAEFNPRGTDVSVVLDLMIHDIDIILSTVRSSVRRVSASGVAVVSDTPDICNARLEFANGCVANLTASRISLKNMRKSRFFQRDAYISVDFLDKAVEIVKLEDVQGEPDPLAVIIEPGPGKPPKRIWFENPKVEESNAIKMELEAFAKSIETGQAPPVTVDDGAHALEVAYEVLDQLNRTASLMQ